MGVQEQPVNTTLYSLSDAVPSPVERRDGERHLTLFRVGTIIVEDRRELCLIKNVSAGGMLIRAYSSLKPGMFVSIEMKQGETIPAKVSWTRDECAGLEFEAPVDVVDLLASSMTGPKPRMPRIEICCGISVRQDGSIFRMRARDVSQGGMKVESDGKLKLGADVVVSVAGLPPMPGIVRWREDESYGIAFNRLLALSDLVAWLQGQREQLRKAG
ncbi:MAG TPA: PilZ domain-containing protein [Sphingomicrobium sp.]|nr:PilZ domain-containing protein [Sphingomicrobium sp.]